MLFKNEFEIFENLIKVFQKLKLNSKNVTINTKNKRDIKLQEDLIVEDIIISNINKYSEYSILSEESKFKNWNDEVKWIIDPIDGSYNFYRGFNHYASSIALFVKNEPVIGLIFDHSNGNYFLGHISNGLVTNTRIINKRFDNKNEILSTGITTYSLKVDEDLDFIKEEFQNYKKIRMIGSASLSIANVATGVFDCYYENHIKIWDVAAGWAICKALNYNIDYEFLDKTTLNFKVY